MCILLLLDRNEVFKWKEQTGEDNSQGKEAQQHTYPQMSPINRHRHTVVDTTHTPHQIPDVVKTAENLHLSRVSVSVCLYLLILRYLSV